MEPDAACCAVLFHPGPASELVRATPPAVEWQSEFSDTPQIAPFIHGLAAVTASACAMAPGGVGPFVPDGPCFAGRSDRVKRTYCVKSRMNTYSSGIL